MSAATVIQANGSQAVEQLRKDLGVPFGQRYDDLSVLIAAVIRRLCGFMCPCPPGAIAKVALRSLTKFDLDPTELEEQVSDTMEDLMVCGDLLELSKVTLQGAENKPTWLFCAPPSYVERQGGRIYLFGIAPDDAPFLPTDVRARVKNEGAARFIEAGDASLLEMLRSIGLRPVNSEAWLTAHKAEAASSYVERLRARVTRDGTPGAMDGLTLISSQTAEHTPYGQRWKAARDESGLFIGRMPQPYGAPLWYLCAMSNGAVIRSLLLPLPDSAMRASDSAWQIQLAIDAHAGNPATFTSVREEDGFRLDLSFPLPISGRRRLAFLGGRRVPGNGRPFSFWIPESQLPAEEAYLREHFWFRKIDSQEEKS